MKNILKYNFKNLYITLIIITLYSNNLMLGQSILSFKMNDLAFGDVFIGYSSDVPHTDSRAAKIFFIHTKSRRADLLVTYQLPKFLENGSDQIPLTFNSTHAAWSTRDRINGRRSFDPNSPVELNRIPYYRLVYLWLGGELNSSTNITSGTYNGTITLTIEFL